MVRLEHYIQLSTVSRVCLQWEQRQRQGKGTNGACLPQLTCLSSWFGEQQSRAVAFLLAYLLIHLILINACHRSAARDVRTLPALKPLCDILPQLHVAIAAAICVIQFLHVFDRRWQSPTDDCMCIILPGGRSKVLPSCHQCSILCRRSSCHQKPKVNNLYSYDRYIQ